MRAVRLDADNRVCEVFAFDKEGLAGRFHPDFIAALADAPDDVTTAHVLSGGTFVVPAEPDLAAIKAEQVALLKGVRNARLAALQTSRYLAKHAWAVNHLLGNTVDDAKLTPEAQARGITITELAETIRAAHEAAAAQAAVIEGAAVAATLLINAATTGEAAMAACAAGIQAIEEI